MPQESRKGSGQVDRRPQRGTAGPALASGPAVRKGRQSKEGERKQDSFPQQHFSLKQHSSSLTEQSSDYGKTRTGSVGESEQQLVASQIH